MNVSLDSVWKGRHCSKMSRHRGSKANHGRRTTQKLSNSNTHPSTHNLALLPWGHPKYPPERYVDVVPAWLPSVLPVTCPTRSSFEVHDVPRVDTLQKGDLNEWTPCWCHIPRADNRCSPSLKQSPIGQWEESIILKMKSKDYLKARTPFSGAGQLLLVLLVMATLPFTSAMSPPPNYSQANMPTTNFTCADKATGGYYADPEAHCQMFHVCVRISDDEMNDFRFLCPNDTVFDQQNFICTNWWEIDCERSTRYYSKNDLFRVEDPDPAPEYEYESPEAPVYYEYVYEYVDTEEPTKEVPAQEEPALGVHRLDISAGNKVARGRAVETTFQETTTGKSPANTTRTAAIHGRRLSSTKSPTTTKSTSTTTTPYTTTTTTIRSTSAAPITRWTTRRRTPYYPPTTTSPPKSSTLRIPHRLSVSGNRPRTPSPTDEGHSFSQREGSTQEKSKPGVIDPVHKQRALDLESDDPFADYDWKRDSSGVTATAKTRYETLFGATSSRGRNFSRKVPATPTEPETKPPKTTTTSTTKSPPVPFRSQSSRGRAQNTESHQEARKVPSRHQDFSNFRFYKTAFGRSYSNDDHLGSTGTSAAPIRVSDPVRLERTASQNTRYSVYG